MAAFGFGKKVGVNVGGGEQVGFIVGGPHTVDGEEKYDVQVGAEIHRVGYREPDDRQGAGSGMTFWTEGIH